MQTLGATRPAAAANDDLPAVLHLVGPVTDTVFSFLGPATAALARQGFRQTVVLVDDPRHRHLLPQFHESVRLVLTNARGGSDDRLRALLEAYCRCAADLRPSAAHLHGVLCSLVGAYASRRRGVSVPTYFSPHGSRLLGPLRGLGRAFLWVLHSLQGGFGQRTIVNSGPDASSLSRMTHRDIHLVESPVGDSFFAAAHAPDPQPRVVTCGQAPNPVGAAQFAQCAVVLADQLPDIAFAWIGQVDSESSARLKAAGVAIQPLGDDAHRAAALARGWIFVAPAGHLGFPSFLAEAMARGLACVAWNTPYHRDLIEDGVNGYLCRDACELLTRVSELLESPRTRHELGDAARRHARLRFEGHRFSDSLLGAYALHELDAATVPSAEPAGQGGVVRKAAAAAALSLVSAAAGLPFPARRAARPPRGVLSLHVLPALDKPDTGSANDLLVVARRDGVDVGAASVRWSGPIDAAASGRVPACPEIHSVHVNAAERSRGVGVRLVEFCEASIRERGWPCAGSDVRLDNVDAYALWIRMGYVDRMRPGAALPSGGAGAQARRFLVKALT